MYLPTLAGCCTFPSPLGPAAHRSGSFRPATCTVKKVRFNRALPANLSFWRDRAGHEVDLLIERDNRVWPVEAKAGATITADACRGLLRWLEVAGEPTLVYAGEQAQRRQGVQWGWDFDTAPNAHAA